MLQGYFFKRRFFVGITNLVVSEVSYGIDDETLEYFTPAFVNELREQGQLKISAVHQRFREGETDGLIMFDFNATESAGTQEVPVYGSPASRLPRQRLCGSN
jgi:hypothetical protein